MPSPYNDTEEMEHEVVLIEGDIVSSESASDSDSDTSYDSQFNWRHGLIADPNPEIERIEADMERIYNLEVAFLDSEKENHKYYLGICMSMGRTRFLLNVAIQPSTFLKFDIQSVLNYLANYSVFTTYRDIMDINTIRLEIMKLDIEPRSYWQTVLLKTCWIRIVQRVWKRVFRERQEVMMKRRTLQNIRYFERHGKHLPGLRVLPTLYGMLR